METFDLIVVAGYVLSLIGIAWFVSREKKGHAKNTQDYFLASKALPWWAIGASLIAANISAEQIIGQSGQGFAVGLAIAAYEWQAAIVLLVVAKFFLPIFLKRGIYTMPQFLNQRYGHEVKTLMSIFWILLYTAVNLTTVLWMGGLAVQSVTGAPIFVAMAGLAVFAVVYSIYGGLKAVALTDIIQVVVLILGGLVITWISLSLVGGGHGPMAGFETLREQLPGHFKMILSRDNPAYSNLPGIWTLLGGLWVLHFSYWGFNQYIIQRALGAENVAEAQKGLAFAAFLKLLIPVIVVIPGIAAVMLAANGTLDASAVDPALGGKTDRTYGVLMEIVPTGFRGLVFAALVAAIVSSLASMMNSISTIFTMDVYKSFRDEKSEQHYVTVGRITAIVAMVVALFLAKPFLQGIGSAFQAIQEYTGFIAPGVVAVFLMGFFWKRTNTFGAFAMLIGSVVINIGMKIGFADVPFIIRIWVVFLACLGLGALVSAFTAPPREDQPVDVKGVSFATKPGFNAAAIVVIVILIGIYVMFW